MAKKTALSKALDKRKKKSAKKTIKQATPQSESYSVRRDKKEKAKPAGYRFKGLDNFKKPTKKDIAADAGKPKSKRKTYFENRKDKSDIKPSVGFSKGGMMPSVYEKPFKLKGEGNREYYLSITLSENQLKQAARKLFPGMSYDKHLAAAKKYSSKAKSALKDYNATVDSKFKEEFGRKPEATDYKVAGIWTDEFSESTKDQLRLKLKKYNSYRSAFDLHNSVLKKSDRINFKQFQLGGVADINAHSGDSAITIQNEMFAGGGELTRDQEIAATILQQLGGIRKLQAMTGAHTFIAHPSGVSFKIKNPKVNYIKIILNSKDLYDLEFGRIKGDKYTVVNKLDGYYDTMLKDAFEKETGMYLSLEQGGPILPEDATQADVMAKGGETPIELNSEVMNSYRKKDPIWRFKINPFREKDVKDVPLGTNLATISTIKGTYLASIDKTSSYISYDNYKEYGTLMAASPQLAFYLSEMLAVALLVHPTMNNYEIYKQAKSYLEGLGFSSYYESGGELPESLVEFEKEIKVEPEVEVKLETTQKATIPNVETAAYAENLIDFMGTNLEGKKLPNGDYVVLSFLFYPIWFYSAKDQKWYGNTDKYNSVTAMHMSNSRPTPNAEMLTCQQLLDRMNQGIQTYDLGGVLVRQLYPMTTDNTTIVHQ